MIKLTLNEKEYQIKNRYDEITVAEFDKLQNIIIEKVNEIQIRLNFISFLGNIPIEELEQLSIKDFIYISDHLFIEDLNEYENKIELDNKKIFVFEGNVDLKVKQIQNIEKIIKSDSNEKNALILSIVFYNEYTPDNFNLINNTIVAPYLYLIKNVANDFKAVFGNK